MSYKLSIRLDSELEEIISRMKQSGIYNLSAIIRTSIKQGLDILDNNLNGIKRSKYFDFNGDKN